MKKNIITLILFINLFCSPAFAENLFRVSPQAIESFKRQYPGALYATWETLEDDNIYSVRFIHDNQSLVAYYYENGDTIGFARVVSTRTLPAKIKKALDKLLADGKILSSQELVLNDRHVFYFDVLNRYEKLFIGIDSDGKIKQNKKVQHL